MSRSKDKPVHPPQRPHFRTWEQWWDAFQAWLGKHRKPCTPCLLAGTIVQAPAGPVRVEDLSEGDLIITMDHGPQKILHVSRRDHTAEEVAADPSLKPYRVDFFGTALVSKWHRIAVGGKLVSAHHLSQARPDCCQAVEDWAGPVTWINLFTEHHDLIAAGDVIVETGWLGGPMAPHLLGADWAKVMHLAEGHRARPALPFATILQGEDA